MKAVVYSNYGAPDVVSLADVSKPAETGEIKPVIDRCYPLANAVEAHAYVDGATRVAAWC